VKISIAMVSRDVSEHHMKIVQYDQLPESTIKWHEAQMNAALILKQGGCHGCWCGNHVCYPPYMTPSEARSASSHRVSSVRNRLNWEEGWNLILFHPPWLTSVHPSPHAIPLTKKEASSPTFFSFNWRLEGTALTFFFLLSILKHFPIY
jgi:hypothetical protein